MMRHVTEQLLINNPVTEKSLSQSELKSQVNKKIQQLMMIGAVDDTPKPLRYLMEIDLSAKVALDASYGNHSEGKAVSNKVYVDKLTDGEILKIKQLSPWRTQLADFADNMKAKMLPSHDTYGKLGDNLPSHANSVAGVGSVIVQIVMLGVLLNNASQKNPEYYARTAGNTMILFGSAIGALESFVRTSYVSTDIKKLNLFKRIIVNGDSVLYSSFKVVGVIGAVIIAIADIYQALNSIKDGYQSQAIVYFLSAVGGTLVAGAAFVGAVAGTILIVVGSLLMVAAGIYFLFFAQNDIQKWLERCFFGIIHNKVEMYPTFKIEAEALQIVTNQLPPKATKN
ncbi:hypothetical protein [Thorsellia anophelis]|uniref:Uncharacterized protein n=1 Tax=Thorsellia anophelis DSM 18579 TaxID=1123402 RepID=A0A1I0FAZ3_9GAMM|nr:hypothetical protein [Thorsellia anophelis]SET55111.1 hypothetical protein SAMN02583745_02698 [Thorsellia anophelis DSM 18579]